MKRRSLIPAYAFIMLSSCSGAEHIKPSGEIEAELEKKYREKQ